MKVIIRRWFKCYLKFITMLKVTNGLYQISNFGRVIALTRTVHKGKCHRSWDEHYLKCAVDKNGYVRTHLAKNGINKTVKVHRLVAEAFIPNPENKPFVNHKDGNKQNNHVDNLEWCTKSENEKHAFKIGLKSHKGERNTSHKLTWEQVKYIRSVYKPRDKKYGATALAKQFNVHRKTIGRIALNQYWKEGDLDEN